VFSATYSNSAETFFTAVVITTRLARDRLLLCIFGGKCGDGSSALR
jgi:hypothetical protein